MTLEERADLIACAAWCRPGGVAWCLIRDRALAQLREAVKEAERVRNHNMTDAEVAASLGIEDT